MITTQTFTNSQASIQTIEFKKTFMFQDSQILNLDVSYPQINLFRNPYAQNVINSYYQQVGSNYVKYASTTLQINAISSYRYAHKNNFPFNAYDAVMKYTVTMNQDCLLSIYYDQYEYTGGAHGNTVRASDSWNLTNGDVIEMKDLFPEGENYQALVIAQILKQANVQNSQNEFMYFDDYKTLIIENFNPEQFYLTPIGIAVYYQQYDIGPYASGIITFEIPYGDLNIKSPGC